jgi:hypothetical protein
VRLGTLVCVTSVPPLHRRSALRASGYSLAELRRKLAAGELRPVRRGAYVHGELPNEAEARHLLAVHAAVAELSDESVISHGSAALLHGLPLWNVPLARVHATRDRRRSGGRRDDRVHLHSAPLGPNEIVEVGGVLVTSVAVTVLDIARTVPFEEAVVVADHALAQHLLTAEQLAEAMARRRRWPGMPAARRSLGFAAAGSRSVGESRSRVAIARAGLPEPVLQWVVHDAAGRSIGEADFGWPHLRTIGEFDGRIKYGRLQDAAEAVYHEKRREDAMRAEDLGVVRWGWDAFDDFSDTAAHIRRWFRPA